MASDEYFSPKSETIGVLSSRIHIVNPEMWRQLLNTQSVLKVFQGDDEDLPEGLLSASIDMYSTNAGGIEERSFYGSVDFILPDDSCDYKGWQDELLDTIVNGLSVLTGCNTFIPPNARQTCYIELSAGHDLQIAINEEKDKFSILLNSSVNPEALAVDRPTPNYYRQFQQYLLVFNTILASIKALHGSSQPLEISLNPHGAIDDETEPLPKHALVEDNEHNLETTPKLDDLGGLYRPKAELRKIAAIIQHPELASTYGLTPRHFLLHGPTGTGKTELVKAFASEINAELRLVSSTEITDQYVGNSGKNMKALFDTVKQTAAEKRVVLFFDKFDSFAPQGRGGTTERTDVKNILMQELSTLQAFPNIIVAAATNCDLDTLDDALTSGGSLSPIHVAIPTDAERADIWATKLLKTYPESDWNSSEAEQKGVGFDHIRLANMTSDMTGHDIKRILTIVAEELFSQAIAYGRHIPVTQSDIERAITSYRRS